MKVHSRHTMRTALSLAAPWPALAVVLVLSALAPLPATAAPRCPPHLKQLDLPDGGHYCGQLKNGKLQGQGRIDWKNKQSYVGQFSGGYMQGHGHIVTPQYEYVGQLYEGLMQGQGKLTMSGVTFEGQFQKGVLTGRGRMDTGNGSTLEGEFENFTPKDDSPVIITWTTGDRYEGPQLASMPHGEGVWTRADKAKVQGDFEFGSLSGQARINYPDGAVYTGPVDRRMQAQGKGELRRANGDVYAGRFAADQPDGAGQLTRADGSVQTGSWRANEYVGAQSDGDSAAEDTPEDTRQLAERNIETALYNQPALLQRQWDQLQPTTPGQPQMYALFVAGDGSQEVFRREVTYVDEQFARRFGTRGHAVNLVNSRTTVDKLPLATDHSIALALQQLAQKMDREHDFLFVFLTSHGSQDHKLSLGMNGMSLADFPAKRLGELLKASGIRNQIVVVSACYSGGFVPALQGERTWVITAASADRTSFGCADDNQFTYFGRALFKDALAESTTLSQAVARADQLVREREDNEAAKAQASEVTRQPARRSAKTRPAPAPTDGSPQAKESATQKTEPSWRSLPQSSVTPAFQAEVDAWFSQHPPVAAGCKSAARAPSGG